MTLSILLVDSISNVNIVRVHYIFLILAPAHTVVYILFTFSEVSWHVSAQIALQKFTAEAISHAATDN